jgi:pimeloyl-ACP methyl ester carboxylesterase
VFAQHYQVITFDVRGHGRSDKPRGPYSVPLFADDAAALIRALDIAPTHVVGISMGGMIALQLAVSAPELIRSLVVVNTGPELVPRTRKERLEVLQRVWLVRLMGMRKMGQVLSKRLLPKPEHEEIRRVFVERWAENDKRAYLAAMRGLVGWSVVDHLHTIHCPTLLVAADQDYTPLEAKMACIMCMPNARLAVIADSRHATPVEHPDEFNRTVLSFLAGLDRRRTRRRRDNP